MREDLCEVGQNLWENYRIDYEEGLYKNYVDHIKSCPECIQKLMLTKEDIDILNIPEDDLEPIDDRTLGECSDDDLVEEIKRRRIKIEIPGNDNIPDFGAYDRPHCYDCGTICTPITMIKIGSIIFDIEEYTNKKNNEE